MGAVFNYFLSQNENKIMWPIYFLSFYFFAYLLKTNKSNSIKYNSIIFYCFGTLKFFYFYCLFIDTESHYVGLTGLEFCQPGWAQPNREKSASSDSQVLELKELPLDLA